MKKTICKVAGCCRLAIPPHKYCLEHQAQERAELERGQVPIMGEQKTILLNRPLITSFPSITIWEHHLFSYT